MKRIILAITLTLFLFAPASFGATKQPNFIFIFCDNLGWADVGCFGSKLHRTPNIDRMAAEGAKFTSFYVTSGVCTPSRSSLMTGCYPRRINMHNTKPDGFVLRPVSPNGLNPDEVTIAESLKTEGYATAIIGKWHLGDQPEFLPTRQGFDYYFGIPYSDDMTPRAGKPWPPLPLMENENVIEAPVDRNLLTKRYTEKAINYIRENKDRPFFLYLPHAMPGSTRAPYASENFLGKSKNGKWGDSVEEIDWSTGEILKTLKELKLDDNTLVIWTSDNGAPKRTPVQGLNTPLAGWGYTTAEGGQRVPTVMRWPGKIPAGTICDEIATTMDILPTFARMAGGPPPQGRIIDGKDISPLIFGAPGAKSPHAAFFYYYVDELQAVRSGKWKMYLPVEKTWRNRDKLDTGKGVWELYDLVADVGEKNNIADVHPDIVRQLAALAETAREDLGDKNHSGKGQRPHGRVENPQPLKLGKR